MPHSTLRWGISLGLVGAGLGVFALLFGAFFFPIPPSTTAEAVAAAILLRGTLALLALGVTLGLSYYAGLRVERDRQRDLPSPTSVSAAGIPSVPQLPVASANERMGSLIAGLLVAFCWWFGTTLTGYLLPLLPQTASAAADPSQLLQHIVLGAIIVILGTGLGGLGSRAPAAKALLSQITLPAPVITPAISATSVVAPTTPGIGIDDIKTAEAAPVIASASAEVILPEASVTEERADS